MHGYQYLMLQNDFVDLRNAGSAKPEVYCTRFAIRY